jgi:integrase
VIQCRSDADKKACHFAHNYCQKLQEEYDKRALYPEQFKQKDEADRKAEMDFIKYVSELIERRRLIVSRNSTNQWILLTRLLEQFAGKTIKFGDLTPQWCNQFRDFLITTPLSKGKILSSNSAKTYLTYFKNMLSSAYKDGILQTDLNIHIKNVRGEESQRVYLTEAELQKLADTPCGSENTRRASLFSALTGLRYSDIAKLTWAEVRADKETPRIEFRQKKTKGIVYMPISKQALELCGEKATPESLVFPQLTDGHNINKTVSAWAKKADIQKHVTFHCFRHTYATLLLKNGTDIYTVSKMLGHTDVKTTQIYAKVVDTKKDQAAQAINIKI